MPLAPSMQYEVCFFLCTIFDSEQQAIDAARSRDAELKAVRARAAARRKQADDKLLRDIAEEAEKKARLKSQGLPHIPNLQVGGLLSKVL